MPLVGSRAAIIALVPLALAAAAHARPQVPSTPVAFNLNTAQLQIQTSNGQDGRQWADASDYLGTATIGSQPIDPNGIKVFGNALDGDSTTDRAARFGGEALASAASALGDGTTAFRLHISGDYQVVAPLGTDQFFRVAFAYGWEFDGGQLRELGPGAGFGTLNSEGGGVPFMGGEIIGMGIGFGEDDSYQDPGRVGIGFTFNFDNDFAFGNLPGLDHGSWEANLPFEWIGFGPDSTFTLNVPFNSIDITVVPTPASAGLAGLAGLVALRRRRPA